MLDYPTPKVLSINLSDKYLIAFFLNLSYFIAKAQVLPTDYSDKCLFSLSQRGGPKVLSIDFLDKYLIVLSQNSTHFIFQINT